MHDLIPGTAIVDDVKKMALLRYSRPSPERLDIAVAADSELPGVPRLAECFKASTIAILEDPKAMVFDCGPTVIPEVGCALSYCILIPAQGTVQPVKDGE